MLRVLRPGAAALRSRAASPSGFVSVGLVVSLLVGALAVVVGQGASRVLLELGDGAAWLPTDPRGTVTLVDGSTGRPTAEVRLASGDGSSLQVVERDGQVYVLDSSTGVLTRIDAATFEAPQAVGTQGTASRVLVGNGVAYVVDAEAGVVRVLDGTSLRPVGEPVQVPGGVASAATDASGTAFFADPDGNVVVVDRAGKQSSWRVAGCAVQLSSVAGAVVATATCSGEVRRLRGDGPAEPMGVPGLAGTDGVLTPDEVLGEALAFVVPGGLAVLDTTDGSVQQLPLPRVGGAVWGAPVVTRGLVYVPETRSGTLYVLERDTGLVRQQVQVTQGTPFRISEDSGIVFVNDPASDTALTVDDNGTVREVTKYDEQVAALAKEPVDTPVQPAPPVAPPPDAPSTQPPRPAPAPAPGPPADGPPVTVPDPGDQGPPDPAAPPPPPPPPVPGQPTIVAVTPGDRSVRVEFAPPADGGAVDRYTLQVSSGGSVVTPREVSQPGPTTFLATFDRCLPLELVVLADGPDGTTPSAPQVASSCVRAGQVQNVRAVADGVDAVTATWTAPTAGSAPFTYQARLGDGPWTPVDDGLTARFPVTGPGSYTVTVVATGADGERGEPVTSAPVQIAYVTAGQVTSLRASAASHQRVEVAWSAPRAGTGPFTYRVRLQGSGAGWQEVGAETTRAFGGLDASTTYTAEVQARGRDGRWGAAATAEVRTPEPPLPPTKTIVECTDDKVMPGGGRKSFYGESCRGGTSATGTRFTVYADADPRLDPLTRYRRDRDTDKGHIPDYVLSAGGGGDFSGFSPDGVIGYVPREGGTGMNQLYWDYWDGSYSWKSWSFRPGWPGWQPENGGVTRRNQGQAFRAV